MSVEIIMNSVDIELADADLDTVAGGVFLLESTNHKQYQAALAPGTSSGPGGSYTVTNFEELKIDSNAFKILHS